VSDVVQQPQGERKASVSWINRSAGDPTDQEVLFVVLLTAATSYTATELKGWYTDVLRQLPVYISQGVEGLPASWKVSREVKVPAIYAVLQQAYAKAVWERDLLERIGKAMSAWRGDGRCDGLGRDELNSHRKDKVAQARWKTPAMLFGVAKLLQVKGVKYMRELLDLSDGARPAVRIALPCRAATHPIAQGQRASDAP
jgi:hypothetical protein